MKPYISYFYKSLFFVNIFLLSFKTLFSQDICGGEMFYINLSGYTYQINVYLYTQTSLGINHSKILCKWDEGTWDTLIGNSLILPNDFTEWNYTLINTFPGPGNYQFSVQDSFRIAGINNISNSDQKKILLQKTFDINTFIGANSNPQLLTKQTQVGLSGGVFTHNPNAIDPDSDSLVFSLIQPSVSNYSFPLGSYINSATGEFTMPIAQGIYAIAINIDEWRYGVKISNTVREMLIDSSTISSIVDYKGFLEYKITVFPNPTNNSINLIIKDNDANAINDISIFNVMNKKIYQNLISTNQTIIDLSSFAKGIYFIKVQSGDKIYTDKVIVE